MLTFETPYQDKLSRTTTAIMGYSIKTVMARLVVVVMEGGRAIDDEAPAEDSPLAVHSSSAAATHLPAPLTPSAFHLRLTRFISLVIFTSTYPFPLPSFWRNMHVSTTASGRHAFKYDSPGRPNDIFANGPRVMIGDLPKLHAVSELFSELNCSFISNYPYAKLYVYIHVRFASDLYWLQSQKWHSPTCFFSFQDHNQVWYFTHHI